MNTHAPIKKKLLRVNHVPYMTKALLKAIMKRSKLENKYVKKWDKNTFNLIKNRNFSCKLYKKERK